MLELKEIQSAYAKTKVLHGVSFEAPKGSITTLIGANGAGKTTVLHAVMGIVRLSSGSVTWDGKELSRLKTAEIVRSGIALIPEGRHVFPEMSVKENLEMGAYARTDKAKQSEDMERVLGLFPKMKARLKQLAGTLSGGEQQMLAFGRALMTDPDMILMDEPSMGLAPIVVDEVFDIIREVRSMGKTILLVEQNAALALDLADLAHVLELGQVVLSGSGRALLDDPEVKKAYLGL